MRRALLSTAFVTLTITACSAASITTIPMNAWRVLDGPSVVRGDHMVLRDESPVVALTNMEIGKVVMSARTTQDRRQGVLTKLTLTYDDGAKETCELRVPADTRQHQVTFQPQFSDWRRVIELELMHPADEMELVVSELTAISERPTMRFSDGALTTAGMIDPNAMENGLLKVKWQANEPIAQIAAPRSRQIIVFAAKVDDSTWGLENEKDLVLAAVDRDGRVIKRYAEPVNGRVQPVLFYLSDLDLSRVDRLVFEADGTNEFAIRQIISGDMSGVGGKQKWNEIEQVNDRLDIVIGIIEQGGDLPQQMVWQLKQLLLDYRRLE